MKKSHSELGMTSPTTLASASGITANTSSLDNIIITKIENGTEGLSSNCFDHLFNMVLPASRQNALTICDYMSSMTLEINSSDHYRKNTIILLCNLSIFFKNAKLFKEITREDLPSFLNSYRKAGSVDPLHKWIGKYNLYRIQSMRFFKWLYSPDIEPSKRPNH
jgi:hypothetical protein